MLSNRAKHKPGAWWLVMSRFFLLLEIRDLDKLKSKLEINIVMEKRMHDTSFVNILSMVCNHCKHVLQETSRSAIRLRVF